MTTWHDDADDQAVLDLGAYTVAEVTAALGPDGSLSPTDRAGDGADDRADESLRSLLARGAVTVDGGSLDGGDEGGASPVLRLGQALGVVDLHRRRGDRVALVRCERLFGVRDLAVHRFADYPDGSPPTYVVEIADGPFRRFLIADLEPVVDVIGHLAGITPSDPDPGASMDEPFVVDLAESRHRSPLADAFVGDLDAPIHLVVVAIDDVPGNSPYELMVVHGVDRTWISQSHGIDATRVEVTTFSPARFDSLLRSALSAAPAR